MRTVFGSEGIELLPSPLHGRPPRIPHLLFGCEKEVFGINWLDVFFCSRDFADMLTVEGVPVRYVEVKSDHWNILGSCSLSEALAQELRWVSREARDQEAKDWLSPSRS